jgi:hypothetical protein
VKYRIITDTKDGFTLQRKVWGLFWFRCEKIHSSGSYSAISFKTVDEAKEFMKNDIEERMAEKRAGKTVEVIKVTTMDRVAWRLSRKR